MRTFPAEFKLMLLICLCLKLSESQPAATPHRISLKENNICNRLYSVVFIYNSLQIVNKLESRQYNTLPSDCVTFNYV